MTLLVIGDALDNNIFRKSSFESSEWFRFEYKNTCTSINKNFICVWWVRYLRYVFELYEKKMLLSEVQIPVKIVDIHSLNLGLNFLNSKVLFKKRGSVNFGRDILCIHNSHWWILFDVGPIGDKVLNNFGN